MDITLSRASQGILLTPKSIHGMLWLQTHFEKQHWEALASAKVIIPESNADEIYVDAMKGGLELKFNKVSCTTKKF